MYTKCGKVDNMFPKDYRLTQSVTSGIEPLTFNNSSIIDKKDILDVVKEDLIRFSNNLSTHEL